MSTAIHRLYRAAQPSAEDMGMAVQPPSTSAGLGPSGYALPNNTSEAAVCNVGVNPSQLKQLVAGMHLLLTDRACSMHALLCWNVTPAQTLFMRTGMFAGISWWASTQAMPHFCSIIRRTVQAIFPSLLG